MARLIWTEPALNDLQTIAEYIALDKPDAARRYVQKIFDAVKRLELFPRSGSVPPEISHLPYRQIVIPPCRIFYRIQKENIFIVYIMRTEQLFREDIFEKKVIAAGRRNG